MVYKTLRTVALSEAMPQALRYAISGGFQQPTLIVIMKLIMREF
ncbi:hypothetical protein COO91_07829 [Nostoc flagelliforme CCNUN1]|uniref:Uncharacterized protein n=1 Tax=Nostoc flagelliforme CCNUN1 TaxID=2038116 RepID=A0A2K8T238_9NOSO|nr:hypothetical protein COO91_07829 [Nostoc flagelliforme CCNUN1]